MMSVRYLINHPGSLWLAKVSVLRLEHPLRDEDHVARPQEKVGRAALPDVLDRDDDALGRRAVDPGDPDGVLLRHAGEAAGPGDGLHDRHVFGEAEGPGRSHLPEDADLARAVLGDPHRDRGVLDV